MSRSGVVRAHDGRWSSRTCGPTFTRPCGTRYLVFDASSGQQRPRWLTDLLESGVARRVDWDYQPDPLDMAGVQSVTVIDDGGERAARAVNTAFLLKQQNRGLQVSVSRTSPATPAPGARVLPFPGGRHGL